MVNNGIGIPNQLSPGERPIPQGQTGLYFKNSNIAGASPEASATDTLNAREPQPGKVFNAPPTLHQPGRG